MDEDREAAKELGWRAVAAIDASYERGEIDRQGWHDAMRALVESVYLAARTPQLGSGHNGTPQEWGESRSIVMEAVDRDGTFLDVGCANGLLMESVHRWGRDRGLVLEPYGVDISDALVTVARRRCPQWADRVWAANAATWIPPRRFDFVRTGLEYVPADAQRDYVAHLLAYCVAAGGRLIIGKSNEDAGVPGLAERVRGWGFDVAGEVRRPHSHPQVEMTVFWVDAG